VDGKIVETFMTFIVVAGEEKKEKKQTARKNQIKRNIIKHIPRNHEIEKNNLKTII
jgi:hypothetical protein